jgi:multidrug efflux system membrane fusion protein
MQRSYLIALIIALTATAWLLSPYAQDYLQAATGTEVIPPDDALAQQTEPQDKPLRVRVRRSVAEQRVKSLLLTGQTEPSRGATLKAETAGRVIAVEAVEGAAVKEGDIIARLAMNDRQALLDEAEALLQQRQTEYEAARKLSSKGFQTQTKLAEARSLLQGAEAQRQRVETDIAHTVIKAPFDGVLQDRLVEVGDYVGVGDPVAAIVDLDPLLAVAQLSERESSSIGPDSEGQARLITGEIVNGRVRYVSAVGSAGTRTFRVELELTNGDNRLPAGLTAEVSLPVATVDAHRMSPAALTLDDAGVIGVKTVDEKSLVHFYPVELVADGADGIWVGGLPREITIITVGQEFVLPGQTVIPVFEDAPAAIPGAGGES